MDVRWLSDSFAVSPQIAPEDLAELKAQGFAVVVNNRPDGEEPGQPSSDALARAAEAAGLSYTHAPIVGGPTPDQARATVGTADGKTLAFCKSGTRSAMAWALGETAAARIGPDEALRRAMAAGYNLAGLRPALESAAGR